MLKIQLQVTYDENGNWSLKDCENGETWEAGDCPGTDCAITRSVYIDRHLPEIEIPTVTAKIPPETASDQTATVTLE